MRRLSVPETIRQARNRIAHGKAPLSEDGQLCAETVDALRRDGYHIGFEELTDLGRLFGAGRKQPWIPAFVCRFIAQALLARGVRTVAVPSPADGQLAIGLAHYGKSLQVVFRGHDSLLKLAARFARNIHPPDASDAMVDCHVESSIQYVRTRSYGGESSIQFQSLQREETARNVRGLSVILLPKRQAQLTARRGLRNAAHVSGFHLAALLDVPPFEHDGDDRPDAQIGLALLDRTAYDQLFVAEVPKDEGAQDELAVRLAERMPGPAAEQGRLVTEKSFSSLADLKEAERLAAIAQAQGLPKVGLSDVILSVGRVDISAGSSAAPASQDCVYLAGGNLPQAVCAITEVDPSAQSALCLAINPARANHRYLAHVLNGDHGGPLRSALAQGVVHSQAMVEGLLENRLFLPSRRMQDTVVDTLDRIRVLRGELDEIEQQIWKSPNRAADALSRVELINRPDSAEAWGETLPFPLGSILRACTSQEGRYKEQYETLLHFFEATAAFLAEVHLSALQQDSVEWSKLKDKLDHELSKNKQSWHVPSFGLWRIVGQVSTSMIRPELNGSKEQRKRILDLYAVQDIGAMEIFTDARVLSVLERANTCRNRWTGHGGIVSESIALQRYEEMRECLARLRESFGRRFTTLQLIVPGPMTVMPGPQFECEVKVAAGSNPVFVSRRVRLSVPPTTGRLHLLDEGNTRALPLAGLVQIRNEPQPACYFYNRYDRHGLHLVSYHFEGNPSVTDTGELPLSLTTIIPT